MTEIGSAGNRSLTTYNFGQQLLRNHYHLPSITNSEACCNPLVMQCTVCEYSTQVITNYKVIKIQVMVLFHYNDFIMGIWWHLKSKRLPSGYRSCFNQNLISVCTLKQSSGGTSCVFTNTKSNWNMPTSDWKYSPVHKYWLDQSKWTFSVWITEGAHYVFPRVGEWVTQLGYSAQRW